MKSSLKRDRNDEESDDDEDDEKHMLGVIMKISALKQSKEQKEQKLKNREVCETAREGFIREAKELASTFIKRRTTKSMEIKRQLKTLGDSCVKDPATTKQHQINLKHLKERRKG